MEVDIRYKRRALQTYAVREHRVNPKVSAYTAVQNVLSYEKMSDELVNKFYDAFFVTKTDKLC